MSTNLMDSAQRIRWLINQSRDKIEQIEARQQRVEAELAALLPPDRVGSSIHDMNEYCKRRETLLKQQDELRVELRRERENLDRTKNQLQLDMFNHQSKF